MTRLSLLLPLALLACPPPAETDATDTESTDAPQPTDDTDPPPPPDLPRIVEAEDLDPDPDHLRVRLVAAPHEFLVGDDMVSGYAYNEQVPGPTLRAKRGDRITAEIVNNLPVPTTVHWHGIHVPYPMDGVTWTEDPIAPGETFVATFVVDQVGTFWYHPHFDTARQVDLGLYGAVIVTDPDDPIPDDDVVVIADSWGEAGAREGEGTDHHRIDGAGLVWTFNGALNPALRPPSGSTARVRFINASNTGYLAFPPADSWSWIAGDQGLRGAASPGLELLAPGDRADAELSVGPDPAPLTVRPYTLNGGEVAPGDDVATLGMEPDGAASRPDSLAWPFSPVAPSADPGWTDLRFVLQGDAGGNDWTINGETFPDITVPALPLDAEAIVEVRNISPTEHPFHIHGHAFEVLSVDGIPPTHQVFEDTFNVPIRSTVRLKLVADNPGSWMTHCHILPHAKGGMMTIIDVGP